MFSCVSPARDNTFLQFTPFRSTYVLIQRANVVKLCICRYTFPRRFFLYVSRHDFDLRMYWACIFYTSGRILAMAGRIIESFPRAAQLLWAGIHKSALAATPHAAKQFRFRTSWIDPCVRARASPSSEVCSCSGCLSA